MVESYISIGKFKLLVVEPCFFIGAPKLWSPSETLPGRQALHGSQPFVGGQDVAARRVPWHLGSSGMGRNIQDIYIYGFYRIYIYIYMFLCAYMFFSGFVGF